MNINSIKIENFRIFKNYEIEFDKNLKASANSTKPKSTFTVVNHPPDLGNDLSKFGNKANNANGNANAAPKPVIPAVS